jgi:hypothetical protein
LPETVGDWLEPARFRAAPLRFAFGTIVVASAIIASASTQPGSQLPCNDERTGRNQPPELIPSSTKSDCQPALNGQTKSQKPIRGTCEMLIASEWVKISNPSARAMPKLRRIVVGQPDSAHFPFALQVEHGLPIILQWRVILRRPVHLIEIDPLDAEAPD